MNDLRTLDYKDLLRKDILDHCERLKAQLAPYEALKQDYDFYAGMLAKFDKIQTDLGSPTAGVSSSHLSEKMTKKELILMIVREHPEGISQEDIIVESGKYGTPILPGSASSLLSRLKKDKLVKKRRRLFVPLTK